MISDLKIETRRLRLRLKKKKGLAGREPTTYAFEPQRLSPTPLRPEGFSIQESYVAEREQETTGRSAVGVRRWRPKPQVMGSRPTSPSFFKRKSERATCEKDKALAGREPTTSGFERQRLAPAPLRPVVPLCNNMIYMKHQVGVV